MLLPADQYRVLRALERGTVRSLRDMRKTDTSEQTVRQMMQTLMRLQRHKPPLLKRIANDQPGLTSVEDSNWVMTIDGYFYLMEQRQQQRAMAQRNQCFRRPDGSTVYYRILRQTHVSDPNSRVLVQQRDTPDGPWKPCSQGANVIVALNRAKVEMNG